MITSRLSGLLVSAVAGLAMTASVAVAGEPFKLPFDWAPKGPVSWSGLYVGTVNGYVWGSADWSFPAPNFYGLTGQGWSTDPSGWANGGHIGFRHQMGAWVIGSEVSYSGLTARDTVVGPISPYTQDQFKTEMRDLFTATGKLGYVVNNFMVYGVGGYASSSVNVSALSGLPVAGTTVNVEKRLDGWTLGIGAEYRFHPNMSSSLEYNYISLGGDRFSGLTGGTAPGQPFSVNSGDVNAHAIMSRLNIYFDGPAAAPAK